jgi:hypothetical protein
MSVYYDSQITVENGLTIKIGVEHDVTVDDTGDAVTITRIIRKYKQSGTGWRFDPFVTEVESEMTLSRSALPELTRDLMWAMAIGSERRTEARLENQ